MGDHTAIEWSDATWNPIVGCSRVGDADEDGCANCYAIGVVHRGLAEQHRGLTIRVGGRTDWTGEVREVAHLLDQPLRWKKPRRIFVNSLSDLFHPDLRDEYIAQVFAVMALAPQHTFQILTKRPQRMAKLLSAPPQLGGFPDMMLNAMRALPVTEAAVMEACARLEQPQAHQPPVLPNVWLGVSIERDKYAFRADHLRRTPAAVRWISAEPLLGPLPSLDLTNIDWLVVGGESGPGARPMFPSWVRDLRDRCWACPTCGLTIGEWAKRAPVPGCLHGHTSGSTAFFLKQWGAWAPYGTAMGRLGRNEIYAGEPDERGMSPLMRRLSKKAAGRELDGQTYHEYPTTTR